MTLKKKKKKRQGETTRPWAGFPAWTDTCLLLVWLLFLKFNDTQRGALHTEVLWYLGWRACASCNARASLE